MAEQVPFHDQQTVLAIFLSKVLILENGCWKWTGNICTTTGYGRISIDKVPWSAHALSYILFKGIIPEGLQLDHTCPIPDRACVNPDHLEAVTHRINLLRGNTIAAINASKTHCPNGHEYNEINTYLEGRIRHCRACHRERARRSHV